MRTPSCITLSKQIIESNEIFGTKVIRIRLFHEKLSSEFFKIRIIFTLTSRASLSSGSISRALS